MPDSTLDEFLLKLLGTLNEAQARWYVAREALARGRGGISAMHRLTGMSRPTISRGIRELRQESGQGPAAAGTGPTGPAAAAGRVRREGGGRHRLEVDDPGLAGALQRILDDTTAGDPTGPLCWTSQSMARVAERLTAGGHPVSPDTVARRVAAMGYSLQVNAKDLEGLSPPERDAQFRYINRQVGRFLRPGHPVVSVDAKKKEHVGPFFNKGRAYRPRGDPHRVNVYDYPTLGEGMAALYGAYDVGRDEGFVSVGTAGVETPAFAVEGLRRWWAVAGRPHYPGAKSLLVCADGGGGNGSRRRGWKYHLQQFADAAGLAVTVCHYPPGASKWDKIEHRVFSFIAINWRGRPLVSYEAVLKLIGSTTTKAGLKVEAELDPAPYEAGEAITDEQMKAVNIKPHKTHPQWNYTIHPRMRK